MFLFLFGQLLKHRASPEILRNARGACVELEPAALGRNSDTQCVAGENHLRRAALLRRGSARLAVLARAVDLHDALLASELSRGGDFLDERLDVGTEKLE